MLVLLLGQTGNSYAQTCHANAIQTTPASRYILNADGTALDKKTGLMWKRCLEGFSWNGSTCQGSESMVAWQVALKNAAASNYAGKTNWRLPNIKELASIAERACINPQVNLAVFPNFPVTVIWSATQSARDPNSAWANGSGTQTYLDYYLKTDPNAVLMVRDVQ